jgi:ABC-2 type transport system permease protein
MPAFIFPQLLLGGLIVPVAALPAALEAIARVLPMTYAIDAMQRLSVEVTPSAIFFKDIVIVLAVGVLAITLGAATLRRAAK